MRPIGSLTEVTNGIKSIIRVPLLSKVILRPTSHTFSSPPVISLASSSSSSYQVSTFKTLIDLISGGIFKSIKSIHSTEGINASKATRHAPIRSFTRQLNSHSHQTRKPSTSSTSRTLFSSHLKAPSIPYPTHQAQKGLGSARTFSSGSGRSFYQNIVENVPLGLRALGDDNRIGIKLDQRKWRREVKKFRRSTRGRGAMKFDERERNKGMQGEFEKYFGLFGLTLACAEEGEEVVIATAKVEPVTLILYLEPDFNLLADCLHEQEEDLLLFSNDTASSSQFRLLQPSAQDLIHILKDLHFKKMSTIQSNLVAAGVIEDEENVFEMNSSPGELKILFGPNWSRRDVEQAIGDYSKSGYEKGRGFYEIKGQDFIESTNFENFSTCPSSPSLDSWSPESPTQHDFIISQFYLPSPSSTMNYLSPIESLEDDASTSWSFNGWESQGVDWNFGGESDDYQSDRSRSVGEESHPYYQFSSSSSPFSFNGNSTGSSSDLDEFDSERGEMMENSRSYERGVQSFLGDLEDADRELEWRRASRRGE